MQGFATCTCFRLNIKYLNDSGDREFLRVSLFLFAFVQHDVACELCEAALDPDGYGAGADESFACLLGSTYL